MCIQGPVPSSNLQPHTWGIKIYQVCDSATGYCCNFKVHAGQTSGVRDLVLDLVRDYLGKGHELYVDRYYTSVALFYDLWKQRTVAVGTCMINRRDLPHAFLRQGLDRGQVIACRKGPLMALKWKDKRDVLMLSTKHTPAMQTVSKRVTGGRVEKEKPVSVQEYNSYMSGVDKSDQMLQYYCFNRKTVKWWKKVMIHFISLSVVNAHKVYNVIRSRQGDRKIPLVTFMANLSEDLAGLVSVEDANVVLPNNRIVPSQYRHFPRPTARRTCVVCRSHIHWSRNSGLPHPSYLHSNFECSVCQVNLCVAPCFENYHTKIKY